MTTAIAIRTLHKDFGDIQAVQGVNIAIQAGEVYSLLGPNGAGKTTTISILCGLLQPTDGDIVVNGESVVRKPQAVKAMIGLVPQQIAIYPNMSARENLRFWGRMYGLTGKLLHSRVDEVLDLVGLADRAKGATKKFSGGMQRRLNIAIALLHHPQIVIMDEPTVGIDPQSRRAILDGIKALNREGMTVLYTTHYMEEAQELSHRIGIMDHGKLIAEGSHDELVKIVGEYDRIDLALNTAADAVCEAWRDIPDVHQLTAEEDRVELLVEDSNEALPLLFETATAHGSRITSVAIQEPNLEAVFLHLTGRALRD